MNDNKILITGDFDLPTRFQGLDNIIHLRIPLNDNDIIEHLATITHYVVGGPEYVDDSMMSSAPQLKQVVVMGTGTNSFIDIEAAQKRGIHVDNTPGINAEAVAEFALGSIIFNLANSFHSREGLLRGAWYQKPHKTLSDTKIGIIGLGDIGSRLASKIRLMSPNGQIQYFSRTPKKDIEEELSLEFKPLEEMVQDSDLIVLCVTYNEGTHKIINDRILDLSKPRSMIFNFSNPLTIDPKALYDSISSGQISFTYFDGYYDEWVDNGGLNSDKYSLLGLGADKFIATSHIAAQATGVIEEIVNQAFDKIYKFSSTTPAKPSTPRQSL